MTYSTTPVDASAFEEATKAFNKKFKPRVLLCLLGETPEVITETLSLLLKEGIRTGGIAHAFAPTELRIITTGDGADKLHNSHFEHWLSACLTAWGYSSANQLAVKLYVIRTTGIGEADGEPNAREVACDAPYTWEEVNRIGNSSYKNLSAQNMNRPPRPEGLGDVRTSEETKYTANYLLAHIDTLTKNKDCAIHASIAGGRKSMGALLTQIMSLLGRKQDGISHVLVHHDLEAKHAKPHKKDWASNPWLAPDEPNELYTGGESPVFELSTVDFVRLASVHMSPRLPEESYGNLVRRINARMHSKIETSAHKPNGMGLAISLGDYPLSITGASLALVIWLLCQKDAKYKYSTQTATKLQTTWIKAIVACDGYSKEEKANVKDEEQWIKFFDDKITGLSKQLKKQSLLGFPYLFDIEKGGGKVVTNANGQSHWEPMEIKLVRHRADAYAGISILERFDMDSIPTATRKALQIN